MFALLKKYTKDLMTAVDNVTYSLTKFIALGGFGAMTGQFIKQATPDFYGYAIGISIILAALAGKYFVESKKE